MTQCYELKQARTIADTDASQDDITDNEYDMKPFSALTSTVISVGLWASLVQPVIAQVVNGTHLHEQSPPVGVVQPPSAQRANGQDPQATEEFSRLKSLQPEAQRYLPYGSGFESRQPLETAKGSGAARGSGRGRGR